MKKNILFVPSWYPTKRKPINGIFFKQQAEALSNLDLNIKILYVNIISIREILKVKEKLGFHKVIENNIEVYRYNAINIFPKIYRFYVELYVFLFNILVKKIKVDGFNFDIIHVQSAIVAGEGARRYKKRNNTPYVVTEHSSKVGRHILNNSEIKLIRKIYDEADTIISVSKSLKKHIESYTKNKNIVVIYNMFNFPQNILNNKNVTDKTKEFKFFSLGTLNESKGMDICIKAFGKVFKDKPVFLHIGGEGSERVNLENLIEKIGMGSQIKLIGSLSREDVLNKMNDCDCFVLASRFETFGVVYIEALSMGKPIIATKCGGPEDIVTEFNGKLVDVDNVDQLAEAMKEMNEYIKRYDKIKIVQDCKNRFGELVIANEIMTEYNKLSNK